MLPFSVIDSINIVSIRKCVRSYLFYSVLACLVSSCAIHNKFPYICFYRDCVKQQFNMKPLKKKMQIALNGKKRKSRSLSGGSRNSPKKSNDNEESLTKTKLANDSNTIAGIIMIPIQNKSFGLMDTVIRIYYENLNDSVLNAYKKIIKSFISRTGKHQISEISLTDFYSLDGFSETSVKSEIEKYLLDIGVSKHRLFRRKNKQVKQKRKEEKLKKLLYLEVGFH